MQWLESEPDSPHVKLARIIATSQSADEDELREKILARAATLGADAVVMGSVTRYVKVGHGSGFANAAAALFSTANSEVSVEVTIVDGTDGKVVFQQHIEKTGDLINAPEELFTQVARELAGKFPYK